MSIIYDPDKELQKFAPESKIKKLVSKRQVSLKRTALSFVDGAEFINKKKVTDVALKTIKGYKARVAEDKGIRTELVNDPKQLVQRVQNEVLFQIHNEIKDKYKGEFYEWLPSSSAEPDPEHQLNYGKVFQIGVGEMPGDRWGCKCAMRILTDDDKLEL